MADENGPDKAYQKSNEELQAFYLALKGYRERFEMRKNVLRDRGTLNDSTVQEHLYTEMFIDILNRLQQLESLTAVLRSEE